jgi:hypothetical protein
VSDLPASIGTMSGSTAQRGDVYNVAPDATLERDRKASLRRMVCVAEQPTDYVWKAMARTTTAFDPAVDLQSRACPDLGLTEEGWWSYRFLRSVKKRWTGDLSLCACLASLPEPLRTQVLDHYKNRPRDAAVNGA